MLWERMGMVPAAGGPQPVPWGTGVPTAPLPFQLGEEMLPVPLGTGKLLFSACARKGPSPGVSFCILALGALLGAWRTHSTTKHFPARSPRPSLLPISPGEQCRGFSELHPWAALSQPHFKGVFEGRGGLAGQKQQPQK